MGKFFHEALNGRAMVGRCNRVAALWMPRRCATLRARCERPTDDKPPRRAPHWEVLAALRFFLAWVVLCGHVDWHIPNDVLWVQFFRAFGGKAAVIGFLLVSGYSIAASLARGSAGFYRRRWLRIYPLYFFAIAFAVTVEAVTHGSVELPSGRTIEGTGYVTAAGNVFLLQTFLVKPIAFNGPVWSLSIEAFFYALAPFLARCKVPPLLAMIAVSSFCYALPSHANWGLVYYVLSKFNALGYLWCWLLGFVLYRDRSAATLAATALGAFLVVFNENTPEPLAGLTYLGSAALLLVNERVRVPTSIRPIAEYLGDLSYPLYLYHFPVFIAMTAFLGSQYAGALVVLALLVAVVALHAIDRLLKRAVFEPLVLGRPTSVRPTPLPSPDLGVTRERDT